MTAYNNFIGIDMGKFNFSVFVYGKKIVKEYENTSTGISKFIKEHSKILKDSLSIVEATGRYEMDLLVALCKKNFSVHRANTRHVKNFILSYGNGAKTDKCDAKAIALYGYERHEKLSLYKPPSDKSIELYDLIQRRKGLKKSIVAEKNRLKSPQGKYIKKHCSDMIDFMEKQAEEITSRIDEIVGKDPVLKKRRDVLKTVPGIGEIVSLELLILMPELGEIDRKKIASLAGLAPRANDSGKKSGYRSCSKGRSEVRPALFIAAMTASRSNSELKTFYLSLIERGKKKMVALVALMRKILIIANARIKEKNNSIKQYSCLIL